MSHKLRLVVLGMMGRCPFGGQSWLYLNWLRGLHRLGHEVWYVEDDTVWPYDPERNSVTDDCSYAVRHIAGCMKQAGMPDTWAFRPAYRSGECYGVTSAKLDELYRTCDALLNVVGATDLREEHLTARFRVYVECDPVIAELQLANGDPHTALALSNHHTIVTYGENFGSADCGVPLNGIATGRRDSRWIWIFGQWPMTLRHASLLPSATTARMVTMWSTTASFITGASTTSGKNFSICRGYAPIVRARYAADDPADRQRLEAHGWKLVPPFRMSLDVFGDYPAYFRRSRAEFTVAKDMNVRLRSGWFSERDACYLASGKPVVAQDTGFGSILPTGEGLFAFSTTDEAVAAIDQINGDYRRHCRGARAIAEEYFEAGKVAGRLLADLGMA